MNAQDPNTQLQRLFKQKGTKALKAARQTILKEKIESKEVRDALRYFITECWHDIARPGLLALVNESLDGKPENTTKIAVPLILIGGATDIHDDLIDESETKYGKPTIYGKFGKNIAILAGDALFFKGLTMLNSTAEHQEINEIVKNMFFELGDAEALELQLRKKPSENPESYLNIIRKKAADVEAHTRIAAILAGARVKEVKTLGEYGRILGMLIILKDDYIDSLELDELAHRVQNEHFPMPLLYALTDPAAYVTIMKIVRKLDITKEDMQRLKTTIRKAKGYEKTAKLMSDLIKTAEKQIASIRSRGYLQLMLEATRI